MASFPRRVVTITAVLGSAALLTIGAPLWLPALAIVDAFRRRRLASLRLGLFAWFFLLCESAGLLAAGFLWLRQRVLPEPHERYLDRNFRLQHWWGAALYAGASRIYGFSLTLESEGDLSRGPFLLMLRHASIGDTLLGVKLFSEPYGLKLRYVLKNELLWDPCLDVVGHRVPVAFVRRDGSDTPRELRAIGELARNLGPEDGVLIYPEGTRFTEEKRQRVIERSKERGDDALAQRADRLQRVLPPRRGGPQVLFAAEPDADVEVCAHTGFEAAATAGDLWAGRLIGKRIHVRCTRFPAEAIPAAAEEAWEWLLDRWEEVDAFVTQHQEAV
ncbi:MAG: 1-acyl-sn-glycerol-3-phosphate acyltransferase [Myxococcota bacterium]